MCAIFTVYIILLVNNFRVKNFRRFAQNEFLTTKNSQITVIIIIHPEKDDY